MFTMTKRIFAILICVTLLVTLFLAPAASAADVKLNTTSATYRCSTTNTSKILGITSNVTFKNNSGDFMQITAKASNCSIKSKSSITLSPGASYTFSYKTNYTKNGTVDFNLQNKSGCTLKFNYTTSNVRLTVRTK